MAELDQWSLRLQLSWQGGPLFCIRDTPMFRPQQGTKPISVVLDWVLSAMGNGGRKVRGFKVIFGYK